MDAIRIETCTGMLATLKALGTVCVVSTGAVSSTPVLESTTGKLSFIFGILTLSMVLYKTVLSRWRILHDEQRDRRALRATCVSSNYSGFEEPPFEYRISLSLAIPTPLVELASLPATQVPYQDLTKRKLVTMSAHAIIYDARLRNGVDVGLKVVRTVLGDEASVTSALTSLVHELHMLASVSHPHVLGLVGFASSPNLLDFALVTEHAALGPLPALLPSTSWPIRLQIALDVAHAISYLHARHIAHNAVATTHVLVTNEWRAKLTGLAHASAGDGHADVVLFGHFLNELAADCSDVETVTNVIASCLNTTLTDRPSMLQVATLLQRAQTVA
ncbi:serine/threonine protein kinase [Saprolegnia parasitica CBS 223.65]|uniref:Serine/threonine protein kinase n=1 Tax=Saprolegnia parasitica (strain CBS 223.65) TaxID=695850 RepID=A0A067CAZ8_SAPPC|nr:serine/threonine protein kinase [Saprolegnia parasitica CBS 223.65]KDO26355.1 serine/threonine protein kinase [Saprolegnia parasitica CBS 223.65]|eukprot:XP_012203053.1 serine/threonine protein kinase [Saprolegnia parasitica CBS 223.65]